MNKEITSRGWIWFIRLWAAVPYTIWIPIFVAFFYHDRPSEAHFMYWALVVALEATFVVWILPAIRKRKIIWPNLRSLVIPMMLIVPIIPTLPHHIYLSAADNHYNSIQSICLVLTYLPLMFFAPDPKKTPTTLPSHLRSAP